MASTAVALRTVEVLLRELEASGEFSGVVAVKEGDLARGKVTQSARIRLDDPAVSDTDPEAVEVGHSTQDSSGIQRSLMRPYRAPAMKDSPDRLPGLSGIAPPLLPKASGVACLIVVSALAGRSRECCSRTRFRAD